LGIELNDATLEKYKLAEPFNIPDGRYSDMTFGSNFYTPSGAYQEL
jgi:hypothetical protein